MAAFVGTGPSLAVGAETPLEPAEVEFEDLAPGLVAEFSDSTGKTYRRIDEEPCLVWDDLDLRLKPGRIKIRWTGYLNVQLAGEHRFYVFAWNKFRLKLSGKPLIDGLGPVKGEPISLAVG